MIAIYCIFGVQSLAQKMAAFLEIVLNWTRTELIFLCHLGAEPEPEHRKKKHSKLAQAHGSVACALFDFLFTHLLIRVFFCDKSSYIAMWNRAMS